MAVKIIDAKRKKYRIAFWSKNKHYAKVFYGNQRSAEDYERRWRLQLAETPDERGKHMTIEEAVNLFKEKFARRKLSYETYYLCGLKNVEKYFGPKRNIADITSEDVRQFRGYLQDEGLYGSSINHGQKILRRMFYWLQDADYFDGDNPASAKKVKLEDESKYCRRDFLRADQFNRLIEVAADNLKLIIFVASYTGFRKGELERLKKSDINLDARSIYVGITKTGDPGSVPVADNLHAVLRPILERISNPDGLILDFKAYRYRWEKARRLAGMPKLCLHHMRHTFGSQVIMATGDKAVVQKLLRLETPGLVDRYAHLAPGHLLDAVQKLDARLPLPKEMKVGSTEVPITKTIIEPLVSRSADQEKSITILG